MTRIVLALCAWVCPLLLAAAPATADETALVLLQCGDDEREDAGGACLQETDFVAGTTSAALHLKVGGEAAGCDSEWAASFEFDLGALASGLHVYGATLIVRKTGYSDDSQGFAYLGAFSYAATGSAVLVARDDLTPDTALDILYPSTANVDLHFDVTSAVTDAVDAGQTRVGVLLAGVYSEAGYEDWISIGGAGYLVPPRLIVTHEGVVATGERSWSHLKARFR